MRVGGSSDAASTASFAALAAVRSMSASPSGVRAVRSRGSRRIMCCTSSPRPQWRATAAPSDSMSTPSTAYDAPASLMPGCSGVPGSASAGGGTGFISCQICSASSGKWYWTSSRPRFCSTPTRNTTSGS